MTPLVLHEAMSRREVLVDMDRMKGNQIITRSDGAQHTFLRFDNWTTCVEETPSEIAALLANNAGRGDAA